MGPTEPRNGRTIVQALHEELWKELDTVVDHIMSEGEPHVGNVNYKNQMDSLKEYFEWRGQAQGIAYALAVLTNPYQPDVEKIRAEAMKRWEEG
jgi:hypothetical protein